MKLNLKKTSIALAIATASGAVLAAPVTTQLTQTANDTVLGNNYQQTVGSETFDAAAGTLVSQKDINTGNLVSSTAQQLKQLMVLKFKLVVSTTVTILIKRFVKVL